MGYQVNHKRTRERYNPTPNAAEKRFHLSVMERGCLVCGADAIAHHVLQDTPNKRWRRDHLIVVPLCDPHHRELHGTGDELEWQAGYELDLANEAEFYRLEALQGGLI